MSRGRRWLRYWIVPLTRGWIPLRLTESILGPFAGLISVRTPMVARFRKENRLQVAY